MRNGGTTRAFLAVLGARMPMIVSGAKWLRRVGSRDVCDA